MRRLSWRTRLALRLMHRDDLQTFVEALHLASVVRALGLLGAAHVAGNVSVEDQARAFLRDLGAHEATP